MVKCNNNQLPVAFEGDFEEHMSRCQDSILELVDRPILVSANSVSIMTNSIEDSLLVYRAIKLLLEGMDTESYEDQIIMKMIKEEKREWVLQKKK